MDRSLSKKPACQQRQALMISEPYHLLIEKQENNSGFFHEALNDDKLHHQELHIKSMGHYFPVRFGR
jgi:hypothetical protein